MKRTSSVSFVSLSVDKGVQSDCENYKANEQPTKSPEQAAAKKPSREAPRLYEEVKTAVCTTAKQPMSTHGQNGTRPWKIYGNRPSKDTATAATGAGRHSPPQHSPSRTSLLPSTLTRSETEPNRGFANLSGPASSVKPNLNEIIDKAHRRSNTLLIVVIAVVVTGVLLLIGLGVVIYFAAGFNRGTDEGIITAHKLCQDNHGKCATFSGKKGSPYPENCTQMIPCYYRCYYPTQTLDRLDPKFVLFSKKYYVSGRNGLICGERSTCQDGNCKVTASYAYDVKIDPKSASDCIESTYRANATVCIDTDLCHEYIDYCEVKGQIKVGFRMSHSNGAHRVRTIRCRRPCGQEKALLNTSAWLLRKKCKYRGSSGCKYTCGSTDTHVFDLPFGTPCSLTRTGYCWRGRCFEREKFPKSGTDTTLELLDKSCYGNNSGTLCYVETKSVDCVNVHKRDGFGKAITRYGSNCISWDVREKVPEKYHSLGSTGCILNGKKMPWCYSASENVVWNYCYNFCPKSGIDEKQSNNIRVMTFSYSQFAEHVFAEQAAKHFKKLEADIVAIDAWLTNTGNKSGKLMKHLIQLLNDNVNDNQTWKLCGDGPKPSRSRILLRGTLSGTTKSLPGTNNSVGCEVSNADGKTFVVVVTTAPYAEYPMALPSGSCACGGSGIFHCERKQGIYGYENGRRDHITTLLKAVNRAQDRKNLLMAGFFGQPSHLDWTRNASHLHCNDTYSWSVSTIMHKAGFHDSYRFKHDDSSQWPGVTWSTLPSNQDIPQGRYDFQYYKGSSIQPVRAETYPPGQPSRALKEEWPSNQYSVVVDYQL